jgi:integrase
MAAYQEALGSAPEPVGIGRNKPGSVSATMATYFQSKVFTRGFRANTQAKHRTTLERVLRLPYGDNPLATLPKKFIAALVDTLPPHSARNFIKAMRPFMQWCMGREFIATDPTQGIRIKLPKSDGHHTWAEDEILQFETFHPVGSKPRLALALGLNTVQRRGDVIRMGRQHVRDGWLNVRQEKTGKALSLPIYLTELPAIIEATPTGDLTFLTTKTGKPYGPNDFSEQFRKWCNAAGLPHCTFHGLRKAGCRRLAEAGRSANEIAAWSGQSLREVERYTKAADQKRLAVSALQNNAQTPDCQTQQDEVSKPLIVLGKK